MLGTARALLYMYRARRTADRSDGEMCKKNSLLLKRREHMERMHRTRRDIFLLRKTALNPDACEEICSSFLGSRETPVETLEGSREKSRDGMEEGPQFLQSPQKNQVVFYPVKKTKRKEKKREKEKKNLLHPQIVQRYVKKRLLVSQMHQSYNPHTCITVMQMEKAYRDLYISEQERSISVKIPGSSFSTKLSCHTTADELLQRVWESCFTHKQIGKDALQLQFLTVREKKMLHGLDRPMLEIIKWKLKNTLLSIKEDRIAPHRKILAKWGFDLAITVHRAENQQDPKKTVSSAERNGEVAEAVSDPVPLRYLPLPSKPKGSSGTHVLPHELLLEEYKREVVLILVLPLLLVFRFFLFFLFRIGFFVGPHQVPGNPEGPASTEKSQGTRKKEEKKKGKREKEKGASLDISGMGLTHIPESVFRISNLDVLNISNNSISVIPARINTLGLRTLNASCNRIKKIEGELQVPFANFAHNRLLFFESEYSYKDLNVLGNPLQYFSAYAEKLRLRDIYSVGRLGGILHNLKKIYLVDARIKVFWGRFPFLETLHLINNSLEEIRIVAPNLRTVLCMHNCLAALPFSETKETHLKFPRLRSLSLSYNAINIISKNAWRLPLSYLNLSRNQIVRVDPPVRQTSLRHLNVSGNQIKEISNINMITKLTCFVASFNILERVGGLNAHPNLKLVVLSYNVLKIIPQLCKYADTRYRINVLKGTLASKTGSARSKKQSSKQKATQSVHCYLHLEGNKDLTITKQHREKMMAEGIQLVDTHADGAFITVSGILGKKNRCKTCRCRIPKEKYMKKKEKKEIRESTRAKSAKQPVASPSSSRPRKAALDPKIYVYYSSHGSGVEEAVDSALRKIRQLLCSETEETFSVRWNKIKKKLLSISLGLRHKIYPAHIRLLCIVVVTHAHVCAFGTSELEILAFAQERGVYLKQRSTTAMIWKKRKKTDDFLFVGHRAFIRNVSVSDLVDAYNRNQCPADVQAFFTAHEMKSLTGLVIPLSSRSRPKEPKICAKKILATLSSSKPSLQLRKVPVIIFTDIVNSTKLWAADHIKMREVSRIHNEAVRQLLRELGGYEVKTEGDAFMAAFYDDSNAVKFGTVLHLRLLSKNWPEMAIENNPVLYARNRLLYRGIQVRVGISKGECMIENDVITKRLDFHGKAVIEAARLCSMASGGETLISRSMHHCLRSLKKSNCLVLPRGRVILSGLEKEVHHAYEILHRRLAPRLLLRSRLCIERHPWILAKHARKK